METIFENIEGKLIAAKKLQRESHTSGAYYQGKARGMIDAWEYVIDEYKDKFPLWVRVLNKIIWLIMGICLGFIAGFLIQIKP